MNTTETMNTNETTNESISNDCKNTMSYPPKSEHMIYLAQLGATRAVKHNKTEGDITILKYCNMPGVIYDPVHYARCDYTEHTFTAEKYPKLNIHVKVGEID